jgi:hypothetical protein
LAAILLVWVGTAAAGRPATACRHTQLTAEVSAGEAFAKRIGNELVFRLTPERLGPEGESSGWLVTMTMAKATDDYIYPVTPPLRFNPTQTLGSSYGDDAKASLGHPHVMRFLVTKADFDHLQPLLTNALWPYAAPHPEDATSAYVTAVEQLELGWLRITFPSYDVDAATDSIRRLKLRVEIAAPKRFVFAPGLATTTAPCPPRDE